MSTVDAPLPSDDVLAARLRGFGPAGLLSIIAILAGNFLFIPLSAVLILLWAYWSRTPWRDIGYVRPRSWALSAAIGVGFGVAFKLAMKSIVMPLLGADPINHAYHYLAGNRGAIPATLFLLIIGAGFGEETLFRGWMFERLGKIFGPGIGGKAAIVLITATIFGWAHYTVQGIAGVEQATIVGLVFGTIYTATGRLWMLMCAHAAFDLTAYTLIYWDLERSVAKAFFY